MKTLLLAIVAVSGLGCSVAQKVDNVFDCATICDRYKSCFNNDYDASACASRCREKGDDADYRRKADMCNACITDRSCTAATFSCAADCASIVP